MAVDYEDSPKKVTEGLCMETVYIGVGSNLGDRQGNCNQAASMVDGLAECSVSRISDFYRTEPVGVDGHEWYVNGVISVTTDISATDLLKGLLDIEARMGRVRKRKWDPRIVDLDILLFGRHVINEKDLQVPHPLMHLRRFVLVPLVQIASQLEHPVLGVTMQSLLERLPEDGQRVIRIEG